MKAPQLFVVVAALLTTMCTAPEQTQTTAPASAQPRRPNIVMVLVDDMRWDEMRVAGHPFVDTPNIDRLAREGARFTNAFATTPLCSPSRASFLTGQYPHTNGIIDNTARPSHALPVFPIDLQRAGYSTAFFGKWHMGNDDTPRPGFDHWVAQPGQGEALNPNFNVDGQRLEVKGYVTDILTDYVERYIQRVNDGFSWHWSARAS
jgi:N-acetylglucosamine-6-sulfatase